MSCGIICPLDPDSPFMELARLRVLIDRLPGGAVEPEPDWYDRFERWLVLFLGVAFIIGGIIILGILAYGITSTIIAAL